VVALDVASAAAVGSTWPSSPRSDSAPADTSGSWWRSPWPASLLRLDGRELRAVPGRGALAIVAAPLDDARELRRSTTPAAALDVVAAPWPSSPLRSTRPRGARRGGGRARAEGARGGHRRRAPLALAIVAALRLGARELRAVNVVAVAPAIVAAVGSTAAS